MEHSFTSAICFSPEQRPSSSDGGLFIRCSLSSDSSKLMLLNPSSIWALQALSLVMILSNELILRKRYETSSYFCTCQLDRVYRAYYGQLTHSWHMLSNVKRQQTINFRKFIEVLRGLPSSSAKSRFARDSSKQSQVQGAMTKNSPTTTPMSPPAQETVSSSLLKDRLYSSLEADFCSLKAAYWLSLSVLEVMKEVVFSLSMAPVLVSMLVRGSRLWSVQMRQSETSTSSVCPKAGLKVTKQVSSTYSLTGLISSGWIRALSIISIIDMLPSRERNRLVICRSVAQLVLAVQTDPQGYSMILTISASQAVHLPPNVKLAVGSGQSHCDPLFLVYTSAISQVYDQSWRSHADKAIRLEETTVLPTTVQLSATTSKQLTVGSLRSTPMMQMPSFISSTCRSRSVGTISLEVVMDQVTSSLLTVCSNTWYTKSRITATMPTERQAPDSVAYSVSSRYLRNQVVLNMSILFAP